MRSTPVNKKYSSIWFRWLCIVYVAVVCPVQPQFCEEQVLLVHDEDRGLERLFSGAATSHLCIKVWMTATFHNCKASRICLEKFKALFLFSHVSEFTKNKYLKIISLILSQIHFVFLSVLEFQERLILFLIFQSREGTIRDEVPYINWSICWLEFAQPVKHLDKKNVLFSS